MLHLILARIINEPALHARWLNTLSFMEYVGARKIMKSQDEHDMDMHMLTHLAEEIHHSLMLKKIVCKHFAYDKAAFSSSCMLAKSAAKNYFHNIDSMCARMASSARHAYLLTSFVIETRALTLYSCYDELLKHHQLFRLKSILKQETEHLNDMRISLGEIDANFAASEPHLVTQEALYFSKWLHAIEQELENHAA